MSTATVSNALSGTGRVSATLAERIREEAAAIGFVPRHAAHALRTGQSGLIGLILPNITNPLFPSFAQAIEHAAKARGLAVLFADSMDRPDEQDHAIEHLLARGADGLIVIPRRGHAIRPIPVPLVVIDSEGTAGNTVSSDHAAGGRLIARHLLERGHTSILVLAGPPDSAVARTRVAGLDQVFAEAGGIRVEKRFSPYSLAAGGEAVRDLRRGGWTAIAAVSDVLAVGALNACARQAIRVPDDVSIIGFDDIVWSSVVTPALTSVRQNIGAIAAAAVALVAGEPTRSGLIPVELVPRESTAFIRRTAGPIQEELPS